MDLTSQNTLNLTYDINQDTGNTTVVVKDVTGTITLGTIIIENIRHRTFFEALAEIARAYHTDYDTNLQGSKTNLNVNNSSAELVFG